MRLEPKAALKPITLYKCICTCLRNWLNPPVPSCSVCSVNAGTDDVCGDHGHCGQHEFAQPSNLHHHLPAHLPHVPLTGRSLPSIRLHSPTLQLH